MTEIPATGRPFEGHEKNIRVNLSKKLGIIQARIPALVSGPSSNSSLSVTDAVAVDDRISCPMVSSNALPLRALITEPSVLLLDGPLSALDPFLRIRMRAELSRLQKGLGMTFMHVTHSQDEAVALSDQVGC